MVGEESICGSSLGPSLKAHEDTIVYTSPLVRGQLANADDP